MGWRACSADLGPGAGGDAMDGSSAPSMEGTGTYGGLRRTHLDGSRRQGWLGEGARLDGADGDHLQEFGSAW
jgi:hypothetical protein